MSKAKKKQKKLLKEWRRQHAVLDEARAHAASDARARVTAATEKEKSDAIIARLMRDPLVARGYRAELARLATPGRFLTDEQRKVAARVGITDAKSLAEISAAMAAKKPQGGNPTIPPEELEPTPEQRKLAKRLGITDEQLDMRRIREQGETIRRGSGVEIELPKIKPAA